MTLFNYEYLEISLKKIEPHNIMPLGGKILPFKNCKLTPSELSGNSIFAGDLARPDVNRTYHIS